MAALQSQTTATSASWEHRNQGFISPSQLRQQNSHNDLHNNKPSGQQEQQQQQQQHIDQAQSQAAQNSSGTGHTRGPSFFAAFRKNQGSIAGKYANGGGPVNEFGNTAPQPDKRPSAEQQRQQQQRPTPQQLQGPGGIHPEIRSLVQLTVAHARKVYFSGPLVRRLERQPDGSRPNKDEGWMNVWAQLGGTTLSVWDMKLISEASKEGREVPPTYINVQDAFVQVLGSVTVPATSVTPSKQYTDVLTVNTAGSNLLLFACPSTTILLSWAAALRLAAWEKSRLEEIYTAHLLRITIPDVKDAPSPLMKGRAEGWVQIRLAGYTDWKRYYMVVTGSSQQTPDLSRSNSVSYASSTSPLSPKRMSHLFTRDPNIPPGAGGAGGGPGSPRSRPALNLYMGSKAKERKSPVLTVYEITQAFAVYPERPEMINVSTLMKVEGLLGEEVAAGGMKSREAWMMIMPETESGASPTGALLRWIMALHDAFELYGRPRSYTWDPRDTASLMFGYPVGPFKDLLFLERESAETMDPRDERTSVVRSCLVNILLEKMRAVPPSLPPIPISPTEDNGDQQQLKQHQNGQAEGAAPMLPSLNFDSSAHGSDLRNRERGNLTPITERTLESVDLKNGRSMSGEKYIDRSPADKAASQAASPPTMATSSSNPPVLGASISRSPAPTMPNTEGTSSTAGSTSSPNNLTSRVGGHIVPDASSRGGGAQSPSFRSSSPAPSPKISLEHPQPRMASPSQRGKSPPQTLQLQSAEPSSPWQSMLGNQYSPESRQSPQSEASRYSQISPDTANAAFNYMSSVRTEPPLSPHSQYSDTSDTSRPPQQNIPLISSNIQAAQNKPRNPGPFPMSPSETSGQSIFDEAGALYYMQQFEAEGHDRRIPTIAEGTNESQSESTSDDPHERSAVGQGPATKSTSKRHGIPDLLNRQMTVASVASSGLGMDPTLPPKSSVAFKESGARVVLSHQKITADRNRDSEPSSAGFVTAMAGLQQESRRMSADDNADALAALSFLAQEVSPTQPDPPPAPAPATELRTPTSPEDSEVVAPLRSSFAPSKQAAERKARVQAQEAASQAAAHKPGRANGKRKNTGGDRGGWHQSSDEDEEEEEEEEEDDDEEADSDEARPRAPHAPTPVAPIQPLRPRGRDISPSGPHSTIGDPNTRSRLSRTLPPVPGTRPGGSEFLHSNTQGRRLPSDESHPRSYYDQGPQIRQQSEAPLPGVAQQNMWSQVLLPGQNPAELANNNRDTFIQIEAPSLTMTKAFAPQGLLSAGIQDKEDRSAKKQEEIARESGASLINVPNKPPPPQTGLLGAITAHERERKREGGVGAALTEREREKRFAEDRQRKLDEFQRQQLEMAQSAGGSMYQQPQFAGYNPMMANPMMMGMNPMMTGMMGYPPMMPGFGNAQHMFAAQQAAAQAYQQAMMAFSQVGSQAGGNPGEAAGMVPLNPMMSGGGMMFDPRMTMMGMQMMGPYPMGAQQGIQGMQGLPIQGHFSGMQGGMGNPMQGMHQLGMQNTGGSAFDARFSPSAMDANSLKAPSPFQGQAAQNPSRNSSPAGRGSPVAPADHSGGHPSPGPQRPPQ